MADKVRKATTPVDPRVLDAMLPYFTDQYGNPHSRTHAYGWEAEKAVEDARKVCLHYITAPQTTLPCMARHVECRFLCRHSQMHGFSFFLFHANTAG